MTFISTTAAAEADGPTFEMYGRQQDFWGYVPNYAKLFSHRPEVMARWGRLLAEVRRPTDARRFELVTFVVAVALRHSPCSLAHGKALAEIIGKEDVLAIANGERPASLSDAEVAMLDYARQIAKDASTVNYGHVERLKKHGFRDDEIFDIAAIASARCFFTKILDALGSEPDVGFMNIDADLRVALTLGRPISHQKPEYLPVPDCA